MLQPEKKPNKPEHERKDLRLPNVESKITEVDFKKLDALFDEEEKHSILLGSRTAASIPPPRRQG